MQSLSINEVLSVSGGDRWAADPSLNVSSLDAAMCKSDILAGAGLGATVGAGIGLAAGPAGGALGSLVGLLAGGAVAASASPGCN